MKILLFIIFIFYQIIYSQAVMENDFEKNDRIIQSPKLELPYNIKYFDFMEGTKSKRFFNDNLDFSSSKFTFISLQKIGGELALGTLLGYLCGKWVDNRTKPKNNIGEDFLTPLLRGTLIGLSAAIGVSGGVYILGQLIGDEGSFKNTIYWSIISASIFAVISKISNSNKDNRVWITAMGLPIGAVIGFNSNELF